MSWTQQQREALPKLAGQGMSASKIAAELGGGITRNAVIGQCHRRGIRLGAKSGFKTTEDARAFGLRRGKSEEVKSTLTPPQPTLPANEAFYKRQKEKKATLGRQLPVKAGAQAAKALAPIEPPKPTPAPAPTIDLSMFGPLDGAPTAILSLTRFSCRFPIGDPLSPDFRFCGAMEADMCADPKRPYCPACKAKLNAPGLGKTQSAATKATRAATMARKKTGRIAA